MRKDELKDRRIALADCNNFFVSCERRVDPKLNGRPVVVLSGNDGCIVSRSNEVKALGVAMGIPYFKVKDFLAYHGVAIRSANHRLYQSISSEVMSLISRYSDVQEIYSIDECFFNLGIPSIPDPVTYCINLRKELWRCCRIPVSIGIAPTKTLAKLGTEYAKKHKETNGVFWMDMMHYKDDAFMEQFQCADVWGIGPRVANSLNLIGIKTIPQIVAKNDDWIKDKYHIPLLNTVWELRGYMVSPVQDAHKPQQSIMVSRSFGEPINTFADVNDALISFAVSAAAQLRRSKQTARRIDVFLSTNRFSQDYYANTAGCEFTTPVSLDSEIIKASTALLRKIYIEGKQYKKCGVVLSRFVDTSQGEQGSLFADTNMEKRKKAMAVIDKINRESGKSIIKPAALLEIPEKEKVWKSKSEFRTEMADDTVMPGHQLRFQSHADDF